MQQEIYNDYLKAFANFQGRPYRKRKDFSKMKQTVTVALEKLERFFRQYKHIQPYNFFKATFDTTDKKYIGIEDFTKYSAITAYSRWCKERNGTDANDDEIVKSFMSGIIFIKKFCDKHGLTFQDYAKSINSAGVPWYIIHLKEQNITLYHLHLLDIRLHEISIDYQGLVMENFEESFDRTLVAYKRAEKIQEVVKAVRENLVELR